MQGREVGRHHELIAEATTAKAKVRADESSPDRQMATIGAPYSTAPSGQDKAEKSLSDQQDC
jgi:hypothetical protein